MGIEVRRAHDRALQAEWLQALKEAGFDPDLDGDVVRLRGVGVSHGDRSVDLNIQVLEMDEHRVLELTAPIRCEPASFEIASLAAVRGSGACRLAKIDLDERLEAGAFSTTFGLRARFHLYADHLSATEFVVMVSLFLKEVDEIDNELVAIMRAQ
ncbi:MAG: hypothetical protein B7C55_04535 [Actinomycetales bacterium mxb001]|nr:MAG: hypothetical protein B7C55_04535 [Actinomycetales bacterium mxb001]